MCLSGERIFSGRGNLGGFVVLGRRIEGKEDLCCEGELRGVGISARIGKKGELFLDWGSGGLVLRKREEDLHGRICSGRRREDLY